MSNGIASGVPPADGCAGGVAGAGVWASDGVLMAAIAQAASVMEASFLETIERMLILPEIFDCFRCSQFRRAYIGGVSPSLP
jgi:hypothetical protein